MKARFLLLAALLFLLFGNQTKGQNVWFENVYLQYDVVYNGQVGLNIVATFIVNGMQGRSIYVDMGVVDNNGQPVRTPQGTPLYVRLTQVPAYTETRYNNITAFLPATSFTALGPGSHSLNAVVQIMDAYYNTSLGVSNYVNFAYNGGGNNGGYNNGGYNNGGGYNNNGGGYNNNGGNSNRSGYKCVICNGSGKCTAPNDFTVNRYRCQGSGTCKHCNGTNTSRGYGVTTECTACRGTNRCTYCNGTGKCSTCNGTGWRNF